MKGLAVAHPFVRWMLPAVALSPIVAAPSSAAAVGGWSSYGPDLANSRSQPRPAGIGAASAPRLVARWARRHLEPVDGTTYSVTGNPAVAGGTVYYTDGTGRLVAVDLQRGRLRWATKVSATTSSGWAAVTSSPAVAGGRVYVSALEGRVVAVSARTGAIRWSRALDTHGHTALFSSPVVSGRRVVVGVASAQNFFALPPYDFRGSVAALDTRTGRLLWQTYTMPGDLDGRGGSVWGTAAIDEKRGIAYIGTGQGYSRPVGELTDALLALHLEDGSLAWHRQFTPDDVWNVFGGELDGKDWDIGASPNLFRIGLRDVVGVGDKGGRYATLDRKTGATVWRRRLCAGSHLGGIMTTAAVARGSIWVACNKPSAAALGTAPTTEPTGPTAPYFDWPLHKPPSNTDIFRLSAKSGRTVWRRRVPAVTFGALTEAGGAVFVPNTNGTFRALDARSGRVLWRAHPGAPIGGRSHRGGRSRADRLRRPIRLERANDEPAARLARRRRRLHAAPPIAARHVLSAWLQLLASRASDDRSGPPAEVTAIRQLAVGSRLETGVPGVYWWRGRADLSVVLWLLPHFGDPISGRG